MKRTLVILAAVLMAVMLFAGCKKSEGTTAAKGSTINLRFWSHQNLPWNESNERLVAAFEKENPNIKIEYEAFPYGDFEQKTQTSLAAKSGGADIYELWGGWVLDFAPTGALSPVPDHLIAGLKEDSFPMVLAGFQHDGKYYGVPIELNQEGGGMLILKPWFEEHKIAYPKTWDEMIKIARENRIYRNGATEMKGWDFVNSDTLLFTWTGMILSSGGSYLENDGHRFNFDNPIAIKTLQTLADYVTVDHLADIEAFTGSPFGNEYGVFTGTTLMAPKGFWTIPTGKEMYDANYGTDFDYIPLPYYGSEKKWVAETGWGLVVSSSTQYAEASWKFVEFVTSPNNLVQIDIDRGLIPPSKSAAANPAYLKGLPYAAPIVQSLDAATYVGYINTDILKLAISNAFVDMVQNGTKADVAVKKINADIAPFVK